MGFNKIKPEQYNIGDNTNPYGNNNNNPYNKNNKT
jgi:hypothetical protein